MLDKLIREINDEFPFKDYMVQKNIVRLNSTMSLKIFLSNINLYIIITLHSIENIKKVLLFSMEIPLK